ncbi:helix-turn-helix transcriptional regulator [Pontibacter sp. JH31]|uniref:Helix-turn-helix transcriptional regulator n=2 Tax=Pontibacter aquaedesilientis TaxID=2766980 RepID=A0ABR7XL68_9BACT|nr:helix-turn-helix transcriptional regulator [Pontibacter aquaedesilientis]
MINVRDKKLIQKFGYHLRELRTSAGFTQEQLANDADIPINQVGRIERGEINPTLSTLNALSRALNKTLPQLVDFPVSVE